MTVVINSSQMDGSSRLKGVRHSLTEQKKQTPGGMAQANDFVPHNAQTWTGTPLPVIQLKAGVKPKRQAIPYTRALEEECGEVPSYHPQLQKARDIANQAEEERREYAQKAKKLELAQNSTHAIKRALEEEKARVEARAKDLQDQIKMAVEERKKFEQEKKQVVAELRQKFEIETRDKKAELERVVVLKRQVEEAQEMLKVEIEKQIQRDLDRKGFYEIVDSLELEDFLRLEQTAHSLKERREKLKLK